MIKHLQSKSKSPQLLLLPRAGFDDWAYFSKRFDGIG
jgi:hypothetical protein